MVWVPAEPQTSRVSSLLSYAILLGGVLTMGIALYMVVTNYSSLPYRDGWIQVQVAARGDSPFAPAWLWELRNEHRMVLPKMFLGVDLRWFQARQVFLLTSIFVIQLLQWGLLCWSMRVLGGWRGALWRTGAGLAAFCLFCPSQWENLIWGFQVCFVLPQLLATLSFVALLLYWMRSQQHPDERPPARFLVLSVLAALGASYSLASGSLLWPLLVAAALYLRLRAATWSFAVTGVVSTALYFYHYARPAVHAAPAAALGAPISLLKFWAFYIGGPWEHHGMRDPEILALAGIGVLLALLAPALEEVRRFRPFAMLLALIMAFCLATALLTAVGRADLTLGQALSSRYQTVALLFWCCVGLLFLGATFFARYGVVLTQVCLLAIFARGAVLVHYPLDEARGRSFEQRAVTAAVVTDVYDPDTLKQTYPQTDMPLSTLPYLKMNRLSVFSGGDGWELGKPLESVFPQASPDDCTGVLEPAVKLEVPYGRGLRISGWAWDRKHHQPPVAMVATTDGVITGLGAVGQKRPELRAAQRELSSSHVGFVAFSPEPQPNSEVKLYAVLSGSPPTACYLPGK